jgi:hypothetical protein
MAQLTLGRLARDSAYVAVGFGVLGFQRAQVARRSLEKRLGKSLPPEVTQLAKAAGELAGDLRRDLPKEAAALAREAAAFGRFALQVLSAPASRPNYP